MVESSNKSAEILEDLLFISHGNLSLPTYILVYVTTFGCAAVVGSFGNAMVIIIIVASKDLRKSINSFIVSLALADFMVSTITMPSSIVGVLLGKKWYEDRSVLCSITSTICAPGCVASMFSIAWIAISRYYYIGQYPKFFQYFTVHRIAAYIVSIWIISYAVHLPNHLGWGRTRYSNFFRFCTLDADLASYAWFYASVLLLAIVVAFVFYLKIYLVIRKSKLSTKLIIGHAESNGTTSQLLSNELKIIKTSFKIFVLFLVTWSPLAVILILQLGDRLPLYVYLYAGLIAHCNSTLNFVVYFLENDLFRKCAKECIFKCLRINSSAIHPVGIEMSAATLRSLRLAQTRTGEHDVSKV